MVNCKVLASGMREGEIVYGGAILEVTSKNKKLYCIVGCPKRRTNPPYRKYPTRIGGLPFRGDVPYWEGAWHTSPNGGDVLPEVPPEFDAVAEDWVYHHGYGEVNFEA